MRIAVVDPPVRQIRATGILPRLIALLRRDDNRPLQGEVRQLRWSGINIGVGLLEVDVLALKSVCFCLFR